MHRPFKKLLSILVFLPIYCASEEDLLEKLSKENKIILSTKRIYLEDYPDAFNPCLIHFEDEFLLVFRFIPDRWIRPWLSYIWLVRLNQEVDPVGIPQILFTRSIDSKTFSQSEDARIFSYNGKLYITYHDNIDICPTT